MDARALMAQLGDDAEEAFARAMRCETKEDLVELAEVYSIELTEQQADELFSYLNREGEGLSTFELEAVTGGTEEEKPKPPWPKF